MNDSPLRKFCESPHRKLIVTIVTSLFGLLVLIPLVDDTFDKKESRAALTDELDEARQIAETLPKLEQRASELAAELEAVETRVVTEASISRYRSRLVDRVREAGCRIGRIDVGAPLVRPWNHQDDPLAQAKAVGQTQQSRTPFTLEQRNVVLYVDGPMESVLELMKQIHEDKTFAYPHRVELHSSRGPEGAVALEMEMWLFALTRKSTS